jgi:hypothetical protein
VFDFIPLHLTLFNALNKHYFASVSESFLQTLGKSLKNATQFNSPFLCFSHHHPRSKYYWIKAP